MKLIREEKGITLIVLAVMIIVVMILAGVTITAIVNKDIVGYAKEAKNAVEEQDKAEKDKINQVKQDLISGGAASGSTAEYEIKSNGWSTDTIADIKSGVPIPVGFAFKEGTKEDGLVIQDSKGNEFVWVPCTLDGSNGTLKYQSYFGGSDGPVPSEVSSWGQNHTSQISKYGGFYVARYEAGIPETWIYADDANEIPVSKKNAIPWNHVDFFTAKQNAEGMCYTSTIKSGLITGIQWDTIMKWYENSGMNVGDTSWGNSCYSYLPEITEFSYDTGYNWNNWDDIKYNGLEVLLKTGNTDSTRVKNIYDMSGNLAEWSNEPYAKICGGSYSEFIIQLPIEHWSWDTSSNDFIGFRAVLYIK